MRHARCRAPLLPICYKEISIYRRVALDFVSSLCLNKYIKKKGNKMTKAEYAVMMNVSESIVSWCSVCESWTHEIDGVESCYCD
jgi:hypothetical protein